MILSFSYLSTNKLSIRLIRRYLKSILYVCHSVCLSFCMSVILYVCHSVCLSFCMSVILYVCHSVCLSAYVSVWLYVCLPVRLSVCLPVCLRVCLTICLPACVSICLSVFLSVSLPLRLLFQQIKDSFNAQNYRNTDSFVFDVTLLPIFFLFCKQQITGTFFYTKLGAIVDSKFSLETFNL